MTVLQDVLEHFRLIINVDIDTIITDHLRLCIKSINQNDFVVTNTSGFDVPDRFFTVISVGDHDDLAWPALSPCRKELGGLGDHTIEVEAEVRVVAFVAELVMADAASIMCDLMNSCGAHQR